METDKIIGSSLESLTADHSAIEAERQQAHAQVEDVQRREQEYRSRVREFEQEINRHPGLSPLEKSAWRSAIRKSPPEQIETTAYAITEMLGRLNDLFSQADLPVFDFGIGDNNVEVTAFTTTGSGLVVSDNDWYVETEGKNFQGTDSEQSKSIKVDELRRVLVSAEDVEDAWSEFTQTAADGQRSRMQTAYLAIGQDAIVAISEKLFESDFSSPYENLSDLISRRAKDIGIDINEVSYRSAKSWRKNGWTGHVLPPRPYWRYRYKATKVCLMKESRATRIARTFR